MDATRLPNTRPLNQHSPVAKSPDSDKMLAGLNLGIIKRTAATAIT
jgi:hypothetical protein